MFKLFFRSQKRPEADGFHPQSRRYQGPAMRLEEMRTPSGLLLDDTETTEDIPGVVDTDLDWDVLSEDNEQADDFFGDETDSDGVDVFSEGSTEVDLADAELEELPYLEIDGEEAIADEPSSDTESDLVSDITDQGEDEFDESFPEATDEIDSSTDSEDEELAWIDSDAETEDNPGDESAIETEPELIDETTEEVEESVETVATDVDVAEADILAQSDETDPLDSAISDEGEPVDAQIAEIAADDPEIETDLDDIAEEAIANSLTEEESEPFSTEETEETENSLTEEDSETFVTDEDIDNDTEDSVTPETAETTDSETSETDETTEDSDTEESETEESDLVADADLSNLQPKFDSGTFSVGETGEVQVDFLFDGGAYKGQVAIVSLSGMEAFDPTSREFFLEAISRAASNSELGYTIIDDHSEGARFTGKLGEPNYNSGEYQGVKTFSMRPGDEFFLILVPNGSVEQVLNNPNAGGALRPLFSLATANPDDGYHFGQIADITGDGSAFAWEDIRVDWGSDRDYNDIILQFRGAKGKAALMDDVVAEGKDWRGSDLGQALIEYVKTYVTPDPPDFDAAVEDLLANLESLFDEVDSFEEDLDSLPDSDVAEEISIEEEIPTEDETEVADFVDESELEEVSDAEDETEVEAVTEVGDETEVADVVDESELEEVIEVADETKVADVVEEPELEEVIEVADETEVADVVDESELEEVIEVADKTEVADVVDESELEEVIEVADETEVADVVDEPELETVTEVADVVDETELESVTAVADETSSESPGEGEETETPGFISEAIAAQSELSETPPPDDFLEPDPFFIPDLSPTELAKSELIFRLESLTEVLNFQSNNSEVSSSNPVNPALIERLETLTKTLQNQTQSQPINDSTFALVSRLEEMVWQSYSSPVIPETSFSFALESQPLVGIIDTGFSGNNPDIDYSRITWGRDHIDGDNDPTIAPGEGNEHGTHTLGIIAAQRDNDIGIDGINPDAPIWAGRAVGSGKWAESLVEFVDAARESGQPNAVVNLSLDLTQIDAQGNVSTRYEFTPMERAAIEYARQHNVMLVVAAGNDGGVMSALGQSSQEFDNIITVGAAERFNDEIAFSKAYNRTEYSSYGYGLDIVAPGGTIDNPKLSLSGEGVGTMAGTSVATAKVTGAISQVWAANPSLSYRQVIEIIKNTATDLGATGFDLETGAGLLNMVAAVQLAKATTGENHDVLPTLIPNTWSGEGLVTPGDRAVNFPHPIVRENFTAWVMPTIGVALRNSPRHEDRSGLAEPYKKTLTFDAWTYGERVTDYQLGTPDELWYRITGTNRWVPSAYMYGFPGSRPPVLAPKPAPAPAPKPAPAPAPAPQPTSVTINGYTVSGKFYPVFQRYRSTIGNPTSGVFTHSSGATYQLFQKGSIVSSKHGTFPLYGGIRQTYLNTGGLNGWLGAPTSAEVPQGNGVIKQTFANGYIIWNGRTATAYRYGTGPVNPAPNPAPSPSQWQHPLPGYRVSSEYGPRWGSFHYGIDIAAPTGTPVKAAKPGTVVEVGYHANGWGNFVRINHPDGFQTIYAHLSRVNVSNGQTVRGGSTIGRVGSTGFSTGPHLHFEVRVRPYRWKTDNRNPRNYIKF